MTGEPTPIRRSALGIASDSPPGDTCAVIVAGGSGRRMGFDKLFADLAGSPVLAWSLRAFSQCESICSIIVVASEANADHVRVLVRDAEIAKPIKVVAGGAERQDSVWSGINAVDEQSVYVAVHDGARPLITKNGVTQCIHVARECGAASCAHPVTDTIKRADDEGNVRESVDRTRLWAMETPQIFRRDLLQEAYEALRSTGESVTDEVSAVQAMGHVVRLVATGEPNLKVTYPADLALAAALLSES